MMASTGRHLVVFAVMLSALAVLLLQAADAAYGLRGTVHLRFSIEATPNPSASQQFSGVSCVGAPTVCVAVGSQGDAPDTRTLIETFAAGKSAICAESGGAPEIASLGKTVATYPPHDTARLASIIDSALTNVEQWRSGGLIDRNALDVFSEAAITGAYRAVYSGKTVMEPAMGAKEA